MELGDVTAEKFFGKITFMSDTSPGTKLKIPDGEFILCAILLKLEMAIKRLAYK